MNKVIYFFIISSQVFLLFSYAQTQAPNVEAEIQPEQAAPVEVSQPAGEAPKAEAKEAPKAEEAKEPVAQKEEVKEPAVKKEKAKKPAIKKEEVKSPAIEKEEVKEEPGAAPQEVRGTVILRERVSDQNPLRKVARGAVNTTLGWVEIPRQMMKVNRTKGDIAGVFWGPLKGFAFFVGRTAVGLYEVTTFLLPPYKPVVNPEFIFSEDDDD